MPLTLLCQHCQHPFPVRAYRKDTALYCSRACKHHAMRLAEEIGLCEHCGKPFVVKRKARFCGRPCRMLAEGIRRSGSGLQNFWTRVQQCEHGWDCIYCCWPWMGALDINGYGHIQVSNTLLYTHRVAWELHHGKELPTNMKAAHYCHRPPCSNPDHIHKATQKENLHDSIRDQRHSFGSRNGHSKLTEETAAQALELRAAGWTYRAIAQHFDMTHATIESLCTGDTWKHLPRPSLPTFKRGRRPKQIRLIQ